MSVTLENLIESLRNELKQYGEMLALLEHQQELVMEQRTDDILHSISAIDIQSAAIQAARANRQLAQRNLAEFSGVHLLKGWIPAQFPEIADKRFCFVHIDVQLYEPTRHSIEFFYPRMNPGGIIVCDDYGFSICPGARRALDEFMTGRAEPIVDLACGSAFIIRK